MVVEEPQRILQVSTFDVQGGAEKVAWSLFDAYRKRGHRSWLAVGEKRSDDPDVLLIPNRVQRGRWFTFWRYISSRINRSIRSRPAAELLSLLANGVAEPARGFDIYRGLEDFRFPGTSRLLALPSQKPDIVHCHNLHGGYFDLRLLPWLSRQVPLILSLHDAWLLSGHCAHSFACERWKTGCGHCPDLTIYPAIRQDATGENWRRKREIYARSRLYVSTPSRWLMNKVEGSMLAPAVVDARVLPNGVDLSIYHPAEQQAARAALGIPSEAKVLLTTGVMIHRNIWKDFSTLRQAVKMASEQLPGQDLLLIVLGEDAPAERVDRVEICYVPYQKDPWKVARYYQAADIYVHAARADTFPTSVLEAMACGTPVVATAVGGILEQVEEPQTGFLVSVGDAQEMAFRITQLLTDEVLKARMGFQAAERAKHQFNFDQQVDAYLNWYGDLIESRTKESSTEKTYALSGPA